MTELQAAQRLALAGMAGGDPDERELGELRRAIAVLANAPAEDHWNRALLSGLRSPSDEIVQETVDQVVARLQRASGAAEQDALLTAILDACFINLAGRTRLRRDDSAAGTAEDQRVSRQERAAALLIGAVGEFLGRRPGELEAHRSRVLSRARTIQNLPGTGDLAGAVVAFQMQVAEGSAGHRAAHDGDATGAPDLGATADLVIAARLMRHRKLTAYLEESTSEPTLVAWLKHDAGYRIAKVDQEIFATYRRMLSTHSKETKRAALRAALDNLRGWLDEVPSGPAGREQLMAELRRAQAGVSRKELDVRLCRLLEAHLELLPGNRHQEDLLRVLVERYDHPDGDEILRAGLEVLQRLPLLRLRHGEIIEFVERPAGVLRSERVWLATIALVEALVTGVPDFEATPDQSDPEVRRRTRARQRLLAPDRPLLDLLYRLATDERRQISADAAAAARVREAAWRALLRTMPQNHRALVAEGLVARADTLFFATLEEAAAAHHRELWHVLHDRLASLLSPAVEPEVRLARMRAVAVAFVATRNFDLVQDRTPGPGLLVRIALDEQHDPAVREVAEHAVIEAGYALELERARKRQEVFALRDALTRSNKKAIDFEHGAGQLERRASELQEDAVGQALTIEHLLTRHKLLGTTGLLDSAQAIFELDGIARRLEQALRESARLVPLVQQLQADLHRQLAEHHELRNTIARLVTEQENLAHALATAEASLARARDQKDALKAELEAVQRELRRAQREADDRRRIVARAQTVASRSPSDDALAQAAHAERRAQDAASQANAALAAVNRVNHGIRIEDDTIRHHEANIPEQSRALGRLGNKLAGYRDALEARQSEISVARRDLATYARDRQALAREIGELRQAEAVIAARMAAERQGLESELTASSARLAGARAEMDATARTSEQVNRDHNQVMHDLDRQRVESDRLFQSLQGGVEAHMRVSESARVASSQADTEGEALHQRHREATLEAQEGLVHYVDVMRRTLEAEARPSPPRREPPGRQRERE